MYIFFDTSLQVQSLRFEAPYVGKIGGISVGMFLSKMKQIRGEPVRPAYQGFLDSFDRQRKQEMRKQSVNELPDLVPKSQVVALVEELTKQLTAPPVFMQAYSYGNSTSGGLWSRYDVSPTTDKVSIILSNSCS
jgi:hypothetical protein